MLQEKGRINLLSTCANGSIDEGLSISKDVTPHNCSQVGDDTLFSLGPFLAIGCIATALDKPYSILSHVVKGGLNVLSLLITAFSLLSSMLRL